VIGRTMGEAVLGTYRMAMNLASAPAEKISSLIMRTATPLFANVMDDLPQVRR
jgi:O-antigen/teichoic acid export membrane protein